LAGLPTLNKERTLFMSNYSPTDANSSATHPFGKVLAKGTSLDIATEMFTGLLYAGVIAVVIMIACHFIGVGMEQSGKFEKGVATAMLILGIVVAAGVVFLTVFFNYRVCQTEITVYENGVIGTGAGKSFNTDFALHSFTLTWDKITSVDASGTAITGKTVIIHASGAEYKCYVQNPAEMQGIIISQQQKRAVS
jgi:hypothetical protein